MTAPPSNLTRLYYNGSAAKSHSTTTQYRQLRRLAVVRKKSLPSPHACFALLESLSSDVFERRTSTGSGLFAHLSCDLNKFLGQVVSIRVKTLSHTNLVASRHVKKRKKLTFGRRTSLKNVAA